jgi:hypothetical protein
MARGFCAAVDATRQGTYTMSVSDLALVAALVFA